MGTEPASVYNKTMITIRLCTLCGGIIRRPHYYYGAPEDITNSYVTGRRRAICILDANTGAAQTRKKSRRHSGGAKRFVGKTLRSGLGDKYFLWLHDVPGEGLCASTDETERAAVLPIPYVHDPGVTEL